MSGNNKVFISGRLGRDPEMHYAASGSAICRFSVATSERWKDRDGNRQEHTEWHLVKGFGRVAEVLGQYLTKGSRINVWGKIRTNKYQDKDGNNRSATEIHVEDFDFIDSRQGAGNNDGGNAQPPAQPRQSQPPQQRPPQQPAQQPAPAGNDGAGEFFDDDIPF